MHTPEEFLGRNVSQAQAAIDELRFATIYTSAPGPEASHLPLLLDRSRGKFGTLVGHLAKRNPQWRNLTPQTEVLAVFLGPSAYVSPTWYATRPRVPTWNYVTVHARCVPTLVVERTALREMVMELSGVMEHPDTDWQADPDYVDSLLGGIVGFHLEIVRLDAQFRLSQQNEPDDRRRVHAALAGGDLGQRLVANLMERYGADSVSDD